MWESEGFVNVRSISRFKSCVLYRSGVILCCVRGGFPFSLAVLWAGWFPKWIVRFLIG